MVMIVMVSGRTYIIMLMTLSGDLYAFMLYVFLVNKSNI
jgi:hypothetical protein